MRKPTLAAAVLWLSACSPEDLAGLRLPSGTDAKVNELSHAVAVRLERGAARLTVTRQLRNDSPEFQALTHHLPLPEEAIVTSLRIGVDGRWHRQPALSRADEATVRWDELTAPGEAPPATLALLQWSWSGGVDLELFGVAPGASVDLEYELELPALYEAGALSFDYPRDDEAEGWLATPQFHLAQAPGATVENLLNEEPESDRGLLAWRVAQPWSPPDVAEARWATYPVGVDRTLWRLEVDAAAQLEPAPARPNVVFVVDASHSEGADGIAAQLELIAPYLANVPDAQVELVLYRRFAERLFGRFVPASDVARLLASTPAERLVPGNGSNLELGAALAAQALAQAAGTGRIVLFTDEALREGFSNEAALDALSPAPRDTVVHVVAREGNSGSELVESRDDTAALSPVAAAHGGVFFRVSGPAGEPGEAAKTLLGLVRPVRIDDFRVEAKGLPDDRLELDDTLQEGATVRMTAMGERPPLEITVTGKIWARAFRRVVTTDAQLAERLPGMAIGQTDVRNQLSDAEVLTAAYASRAVSPLTSYLSTPADAAPSTAGVLEDALGSLSMRGFGCSGGCGGSSSCTFRLGTAAPDLEALLRELLAPGVAACERRHGDASRASVRLEATADEVVVVSASAPSAALADCLTEAGWALRLPALFWAHRTYEVSLYP